MPKARIEHVNLSVSDPKRSAALFGKLCGWKVRWEGPARNGGHSIHMGSDDTYLALYTGPEVSGDYSKGRPLNHVGLVIDDLDEADTIVRQHGLTPFGHDDYEPGKRFYFFDWDGVEFEMVSYD